MENEAENSRQRQIGALLSYSYSFLSAIIGLIYVPILLSTMGSSEYGLYQLIGSIMSYMALMNSIFSGGITRYYCRYLEDGDEERMQGVLAAGRKIYKVMSVLAIVVGFAAIGIFSVVYQNVLTDFQMVESAIMIAAVSINLIISMQNSLSVAVVIAHERFIFQRGLQLLLLILQPLVVVVLVSCFPYAVLVPLVQLTLNAIAAIIQRGFARKSLGMVIKQSKDSSLLIRGLLVFSGGMLLVLFADQIFWHTNQLILGFYFGTTVVAVYAVASQIVMSYMSLGVAIPQVFLPKITALVSVDSGMREVSLLFAKVGRLSLYPLLLVLTGFIAFGMQFIQLWAGQGFEEAYFIAAVLMIAATVDLSQNLGLTVLQVVNKYHIRGIIYLGLAIVNCATVVLFAPNAGAFGAAFCSAIAMFLGNGIVMNVYYSKGIGLDIKLFWTQVSRMSIPLILFGGIAASIVSSLTISWNWPVFVVSLIIYVILFFFVALLFSMNSYERSLVKRIFYRLLGRAN